MTRVDRWEVGGEFHWTSLPEGEFVPWPAPVSWYLLARHAAADLFRTLARRSDGIEHRPWSGHLWVPQYFCHDVAGYWKKFAEIRQYADDPRGAQPDWTTLKPAKNDAVLAVNFFGARAAKPWQRWHVKTGCILVEDHSHDPVSGWARNSKADYAFSSLRKTIPVSDGAILWSPIGHALTVAKEVDLSGSALKLAAMVWKRDYLEGAAYAADKSCYREWQRAGEDAFGRSAILSAASSWSRAYLADGVPESWRRRRTANVRRLLRSLEDWPGAEPVFRAWPADGVPMAAVFCFPSAAARDAVRKRLEEHSVYCPVHWPAPADCELAVRELAATILTIPADQRYTGADMDRIVGILRNSG
jgi:hypothetical protein